MIIPMSGQAHRLVTERRHVIKAVAPCVTRSVLLITGSGVDNETVFLLPRGFAVQID